MTPSSSTPSPGACPGCRPSAGHSPTPGCTGHYWSTLTATTLLRLPAALRTADTERLAGAILRANTANYREDGSATCAFVMPSTVDGRAAHRADPLADDQDWHLYLWMRAQEAE